MSKIILKVKETLKYFSTYIVVTIFVAVFSIIFKDRPFQQNQVVF